MYLFLFGILIFQGITTIGNSLFFLASRLGDSLLVQFTSGVGASTLPPGMKEEVCPNIFEVFWSYALSLFFYKLLAYQISSF